MVRARNFLYFLFFILFAIGLRVWQVWWTWTEVTDEEYEDKWPETVAMTIIYVVEHVQEPCRSRFRFYSTWLLNACQHERSTQKVSAEYYKHVFYFHYKGFLDPEYIALVGNLSTACQNRFRSIDAFTHRNWSLSAVRGSSVVVTSCDVQGPFVPKYFLASGYSFWTDAYTSEFKQGARFVANMVNCDGEETSLVFPVAVHSSLLVQFEGKRDILSARNLSLWFKRRQMYKSESNIQWAFLSFYADKMNWKRLSHASVSICEVQRQTQSRTGAPHPWEGLFLETKWANQLSGFYEDVSLQVFQGGMPVSIDRTLVVVAFQDKDDESRSNLIYFLQVAIIPDDVANVPLDYIIIVRRESQFHFPKLKNLRVMHTSNDCADSGLWGIGLKYRTVAHTTFILLSSNVRGPFLPAWYKTHWSASFLSLLNNAVKLVGASMDCPDNPGGPLSFLVGGAMAFDKIGLHLGVKSGIFECPVQYEQNEGYFVQVVRNAGFTVEFQFETGLLRNRPVNGCPAPSNELKLARNSLRGPTFHPFELIFYTRSGHRTDMTSFIDFLTVQNSLSVAPKLIDSNFIVMLSHTSSLLEEASRVLVELGSMMVKDGLDVRVLAPESGPLQKELSERSVATGVLNLEPSWREDGFDLLGLILRDFWERLPGTVICNTLWWAHALALIPLIRTRLPAFVLFVYENEMMPNWAEDSFTARKHVLGSGSKSWDSWYGEPVPAFDAQDRKTILANIDSVVFPAEASRRLWLDSATVFFQDNFHVFYNFMDFSDVHRRAGVGLQSRFHAGQHGLLRNVRASVRKEFGFSENAFVMTVSGPICPRKNQLALLQDGVVRILNRFFFDQWIILVIAKMQQSYSTSYTKKFLSMVQDAGVSNHVLVVPSNPTNLTYMAAADLHVSISRMEVSPLNTLEAKMLGVPVLMTPAGGSAEQMIAHQVDGYLIPDFEQRSLEDGLRRIFSHRDPLAAMHEVGLAGQAVALATFSTETAEPRLNFLTNSILTEPTKSTGDPSTVMVGIMVQLDDSESWVKGQQCLRKTLDVLLEISGRANVYITTSFEWKDYTRATHTLHKHPALQHLFVWRSYTRSSEGRFLQQLLFMRQLRLTHEVLFKFSTDALSMKVVFAGLFSLQFGYANHNFWPHCPQFAIKPQPKESIQEDAGMVGSICAGGTMGKGQSIVKIFRDRPDIGMLGRSKPESKESGSEEKEVKEVWRLLEMTSKVASKVALSTFDGSAYWARGNLTVWSTLRKFSPRLLANMGQVNGGCQNKRCNLDVGLKTVVPTIAAMSTKVISPLKKT